MAGRTGTRDRMLWGAVELLRERGPAGVTVDAILERSGAPRGSVYYHFPGGRADILLEALGVAGDAISTLIEKAVRDGSAQGLRRFSNFWSQVLQESNFEAGCPVVSSSVGGSPDDGHLLTIAGQIFQRWRVALETALHAEGVDNVRARRLATLVISAIEGAVVLCRVERSTEPLDDVIDELEIVIAPFVK